MTRMTKAQSEARIAVLEQENKILKDAAVAAPQHSMENAALSYSITDEVRKIQKKGKSTANAIVVTEKHDHKNVSLWTKWGKRIGPMHPDNCIQALHRFANIGIVLTSDKPTAAQLEAYGKTEEFKAYLKKVEADRKTKDRSRRSGQMEKFTAEIAKLSGQTAEAVNRLLVPKDIKG